MKDNNQKERVLAYSTSTVIDVEQLEKISGGAKASVIPYQTWGNPPQTDHCEDSY